jgi:hypothetical protein
MLDLDVVQVCQLDSAQMGLQVILDAICVGGNRGGLEVDAVGFQPKVQPVANSIVLRDEIGIVVDVVEGFDELFLALPLGFCVEGVTGGVAEFVCDTVSSFKAAIRPFTDAAGTLCASFFILWHNFLSDGFARQCAGIV